MILDSHALLREALRRRPECSVLAMSYVLPEPLAAHPGEVRYYGAHPADAPRARAFSATVETPDSALLATLERDVVGPAERAFDLIYLNHHRAADRITRALNALIRCANEETVFVLPGAAPRDPALTGAQPNFPWFVGDVWLLPEVLKPAGKNFAVLTSDLPNLGLLLARGFQPLAPGAVAEAGTRLAGVRADPKRFQTFRLHASVSDLLTLLGAPPPPYRPGPAGFTEVVIEPHAPDVVQSDAIEATQVWTRPPPAFVLDLSEATLPLPGLEPELRWRQGSQIDHFRNVRVLGRDVILAGHAEAEASRFYGKNTVVEAALAGLRHAADRTDPADASTAITLNGERFFYPIHPLEDAEVVDEPVFLATPDEPLNWGMWLLHAVPAARLYGRYSDVYPRFLCPTDQPWQRGLLLALGVEEKSWLAQTPGRVLAAGRIAAYRQLFRGMVLRHSDRAAFDELGERLGDVRGARSPERIYVSRRGIRHSRVLLNEAELEAALEQRGFTPFRPQELPFADQVRLFRNARAVIGPGGAGMFNVVFCQPGVKVVTLESGVKWLDSHLNLFASRGADYAAIVGRPDPNDPTPDHPRWTLDLPAALSAIDDFIG